MTSRRVNAFLRMLGSMPAYRNLFVSVNQIMQLQHTFLKIVPPQLAKHCVIGKFSNGILTIHASGGAVAAKLKHIIPSLLDKLGPQVTSIQISVRCYQKNVINASSQRKRLLGQIAIQNLNQLAENIPVSPLRSAIKSLLDNCKTT